MPGLMEDIWRNRQRSPVTVYSPTRNVRAPGSFANAGTARQIIQQPDQQQEQGSVTVPRLRVPGVRGSLPGFELPTGSPGAPLPVPGVPAYDWLGQSLARQPAQQEDQPFWGSVLGHVVNGLDTPIARAVMMPLNVLDMPRRAVISTLQEGLDMFGLNAESRSDGSASWSDWWDQFQDPTFGFGDVVASTGHKWLDRGIGLAGDIAFDPLTYLMGSGLIAGTGARARVGIASRAAGAGLGEVAQRSGRLGLQALDNAERHAINAAAEGAEILLDRGYYFHLPFTPMSTRFRIPGTGALEQGIGMGFATARNQIASVRPMATMRYWRSERGLQDAITKILTGRGDISFGVATALVNFRKGAGIAQQRAVGLMAAEFNRLQQQYGDEALNAMVHEAETVGNTPLNRMFGKVADLMEDEGMVRPDFPNYFPHIFTDPGAEWITNTVEGQGFKNTLFKEYDFDDLSPNLLQRKLIARDTRYRINGHDFYIQEGSIREINEQFHKAFPDLNFDLIDANVSSVVARYSKSVARNIGEAGGLMYLATRAKGLVRYADDDSILKSIVDEAATRKLNVAAHKEIRSKLNAATELRAQLQRDTEAGVSSITGMMETHLRRLVGTMDSLDPTARGELDTLIARVSQLSSQRASLNAAPVEYERATVELNTALAKTVTDLDEQYDRITARLQHIQPAYEAAEERWRAAAATAKGLQDMPPKPPLRDEYRRLVGELAEINMDKDSAAAIMRRMRMAQQKASIIERHLDDDTFLNLAAGERVGERVFDPARHSSAIETPLDLEKMAQTAPYETIPMREGERMLTPDDIPRDMVGARPGEEPVMARQMGGMRYGRDPITGKKIAPERVLRRGDAGYEQLVVTPGEIDPRAANTATVIYSAHNTKLKQAISGYIDEYPMLDHYFAQIEEQTHAVLRSKRELDEVATRSYERIQSARLHELDARTEEREIIEAMADIENLPSRRMDYDTLRMRLADLRGRPVPGFEDYTPTGYIPGRPSGRLQETKARLTAAQRELADARSRHKAAVEKLKYFKTKLYQEAMKVRRPVGEPPLPAALADAAADIDQLNRQLVSTQIGRANYLHTKKGAAEASTTAELRRVEGEIAVADGELGRWSEAAATNNPWQPFKVVEGADGSLRVEDLWGGMLGGNARKIHELTAQRDWWLMHEVIPVRGDRRETIATIERLSDEFASEADTKVRRSLKAKINAAKRHLVALEDKLDKVSAKLLIYEDDIVNSGFSPRIIETYKNLYHVAPGERGWVADQLKSAIHRRHNLQLQRDGLESKLVVGGRRLQNFDDTISSLRGRIRAVSDAETEQVYRFVDREGVQQQVSTRQLTRRTALADSIQSIRKQEIMAMDTVSHREEFLHNKVDWEPIAPDTTIGRYGVWTPDERRVLAEAYKMQRNVDRIPRRMRTAEDNADRLRAVQTIRHMTSPDRQRPGVSFEQALLRNLVNNYDEEGLTIALKTIQEARIPFSPPAQRSEIGKALASGSTRGGSRRISGVITQARRVFEDVMGTHGEEFVQRGVISPGTLAFFQSKKFDLERLLRTRNRSTMQLTEVKQLASDLYRFSEYAYVYRAALNANAQPSLSLSAYILADRLDRESNLVRLQLDRDLRKLGQPSDTAIVTKGDMRRAKLTVRVDAEQTKIDALNEIALTRELTPDQAKALKNAKARQGRAQLEIDRMPDPTEGMDNIVDAETEYITSIIGQYVENFSDQASRYYHARDMIKDYGSPVRQARNAENNLITMQSQLAATRDEQNRIAEAIKYAQQHGDDVVTYIPNTTMQEFHWTPEEVLANIQTGYMINVETGRRKYVGTAEITPNARARLQERAEQAIARRDELGEEQLVDWRRVVTTDEPIIERVDVASFKYEQTASSMVNAEMAIESTKARLAAYRGESELYINHYRRLIQDQQRRPDIQALRQDLQDYEMRINRRLDRWTPRELATYQLKKDRLDILQTGFATPEERMAWERLLQKYEMEYKDFQESMVGEEMFRANLASQDQGYQLFTDVVTGIRPMTAADVEIIKDLFGSAEEGEFASAWISTFRQLVEVAEKRRNRFAATNLSGIAEKRARVLKPGETPETLAAMDEVEAMYIVNEMKRIYGENQLNDTMMNTITEHFAAGEDISDIGAQMERQLGAEYSEQYVSLDEYDELQPGQLERLAPEDPSMQRPFGNRATGTPFSPGGFSFGRIEGAVISALVGSAMRAKDDAASEMTRLFRMLGFDRKLPFDNPSAQLARFTDKEASMHQRLRLLGYNLRGKTSSPQGEQQMTEIITEFLFGSDYDWSHALRRRVRESQAQLQRINGMRSALGAMVDEAVEQVADPEILLNKLVRQELRAAGEIEDGAEVIGRATDFAGHIVPPEMDQVFSDRLAQLQGDLNRAIAADDLPQITALHNQLQELRSGQRPPPIAAALEVTPAPGEAEAMAGAAGTVPPPTPAGAAETPHLVELAQADLQEAQQQLQAYQMRVNAVAQQPTQAAPTEARTLDEFISDPDFEAAPGQRLTEAEIRLDRRAYQGIFDSLPPRAERNAEQNALYEETASRIASIAGKQWAKEPDWQKEAARLIDEAETTGGRLPWDTAPPGNESDIARLQDNVRTAEERLAEAQRNAESAPVGHDTPAAATAEAEGAPTDIEARRAQLQAQANEARAAGDENAARYAEQQMGWLDEPQEASKIAHVDPVEDEGVVADVTTIDQIPPPPADAGMGQVLSARKPLDDSFNDIVDEFRMLMEHYGPYESMPEGVKQRLAALSASARRLTEERQIGSAAADDVRQRILRESPEMQRYLARVERIHTVVPPSISADVENVLRYGSPTRISFDQAIERRLTPKFRPNLEDEPAQITGSLFGGGISPTQRRYQTIRMRRDLPVRQARLQAQLEAAPQRTLQPVRDRMMGRLTELQAEQLAAQAELKGLGIQATNAQAAGRAAAREQFAAMQPEAVVGRALDEQEVAAQELTRLSNERQQLSVNAQHNRDLQQAASQRAAAEQASRQQVVEQQRRVEAQTARTAALRDMDMDIAKIRDDILTAKTSINEMSDLRQRINRVLGKTTPTESAELTPYIADLRDLSKVVGQLQDVDPDFATTIEKLLMGAIDQKTKLDATAMAESIFEAKVKSFGKDPRKARVMADVMKNVTIDGWSAIATKLLRTDPAMAELTGRTANITAEQAAAAASRGLKPGAGVVVAQELRERLNHVMRVMETPEPWKLIDKYTAFFKTYATSRPGFHVRNAISAVFMNLVDFVSLRSQWDGLAMWRAFTKDPMNYYESASVEVRKAIDAVFASGAGGQFTERGVGTVVGPASKTYRRIMNNRFTNWNKRLGTSVEGSARMGMALDSIRRGQSLEAAVDRVTKFHFNYLELAPMDVTMRRFIPFWTFMSRNLPLQIEQMWLRPQMYLRYQSFVRNFRESPDPLTPEYWLMQGAFTMNPDAAGTDSPWYLAPDLPHTRITEPFEAAAAGQWGKALLSDVNPLFMAPTEAFGFNKKLYTGAPLEENYREPTAAMTPLLPLLALLGGVERGASGEPVVDDRYAHVARSLLPPLDIIERLTDTSGTRTGRQDETFMRQFLGLPVLQLTPELRASTRRTQRAERRDQRATQAQLARL